MTQNESNTAVWGFAFISNVLAWLAVPDHMAIVNHAIGTVAGILAIVIAVRKLWRSKQ